MIEGRMSLQRVRWMVKAGEFPCEDAGSVLGLLLDMLDETMPGILRSTFVSAAAATEAEAFRTEREEALGL